MIHAQVPPVSNFLQSLFFIPFTSARTGDIQPLLIAGWTLNYEMFFYAVFACAFIVVRRYRLLFIGVVLGSLVASRYVVVPSTPITMTYTSPLLIEFIVGCLLGFIYERKALPRPAIAFVLLVVGSLLLISSGMLPASSIGGGRFVRWGLPAFLVVVGALSLEPLLKVRRLPMLLGNASYSIYLTHGVVLSTLKTRCLDGSKHIATIADWRIHLGGLRRKRRHRSVGLLVCRDAACHPVEAGCCCRLANKNKATIPSAA